MTFLSAPLGSHTAAQSESLARLYGSGEAVTNMVPDQEVKSSLSTPEIDKSFAFLRGTCQTYISRSCPLTTLLDQTRLTYFTHSSQHISIRTTYT